MFHTIPDSVFFFELEGDHRKLNAVYINQGVDEYHEELLSNIVYDIDGKVKVTQLDKPTKDWDYFITCGFIA